MAFTARLVRFHVREDAAEFEGAVEQIVVHAAIGDDLEVEVVLVDVLEVHVAIGANVGIGAEAVRFEGLGDLGVGPPGTSTGLRVEWILSRTTCWRPEIVDERAGGRAAAANQGEIAINDGAIGDFEFGLAGVEPGTAEGGTKGECAGAADVVDMGLGAAHLDLTRAGRGIP